jgi:hypothetical protein
VQAKKKRRSNAAPLVDPLRVQAIAFFRFSSILSRKPVVESHF